MVDFDRLQSAYLAACEDLLNWRTPVGHWEGRLSSSALSSATAVSALALVRRHLERDDSSRSQAQQQKLRELIFGGLHWLVAAQNADGGWGDTDRSVSNIATTMLVRAAFQLTCVPADHADLLERADRYIAAQGGISGLRRRYGGDKTFAVPILTNCALAGLIDWKEVSPLPFELACFPQSWFRFLRLPVVSYAIPALVAIGQARYFHRPPRNPLVRWWRRTAVEKSLRVLEQMQPESGGFLEATPLTSFVVMSLASIGQSWHPVVRRGLEFLVSSVREDGSWPIDTNLATWVTTLSINAFGSGDAKMAASVAEGCVDWLLACQCREVHPYTGTAPGGWGWSDLSGSVPDADDTSGALLALASLAPYSDDCDNHAKVGREAFPGERQMAEPHGGWSPGRIRQAAAMGVRWLLDLQNADGGWPTFCRGWGKLPFDRSGTDLTAHAIRALNAWRNVCKWVPTLAGAEAGHLRRNCDQRAAASDAPVFAAAGHRRGNVDEPNLPFHAALPQPPLYIHPCKADRLDRAIEKGFAYLARQQRADGSWSALWFGNQHHPSEENPVYGTARVLLAYTDLGKLQDPCARRGLNWLAEQQRGDGAWGTEPIVEETALAVEALLACGDSAAYHQHIERGLDWLVDSIESGQFRHSSPIGFYFAKLWYYEALYPVIFTVAALGRAVRQFEPLRAESCQDRTPA